jgi:hypothetical protein
LLGRRRKGSPPVMKVRALRALLSVLPEDGVMGYGEMVKVMVLRANVSFNYAYHILNELIVLNILTKVGDSRYKVNKEMLKKYIQRLESDPRIRGGG